MKERVAYVAWIGLCFFVGCSLLVSPNTSELATLQPPDADAGDNDGFVDSNPDATNDSDASASDGDAEGGPPDSQACDPLLCPDDGDPCTVAVCNPCCSNVPVNPDDDRDGYRKRVTVGAAICGDDCDDSRSNVYPGNTELCGDIDGLDNNCDGVTDPVCDGDNCNANPQQITLTKTSASTYQASVTATFVGYRDDYGHRTSGAQRDSCPSNADLDSRRDRVYWFMLDAPPDISFTRLEVEITNTSTQSAVFGLNNGVCNNSTWAGRDSCIQVGPMATSRFWFTGLNPRAGQTLYLLVQASASATGELPLQITATQMAPL